MDQMRRRHLVIAAGAMLTAPFARAQAPARVPIVGVLYPNPSRYQVQGKEHRALDWYANFLSGLGWKVGTDVLIEDASAEGDDARLPSLAAALVAKKVDVIWTAGPEATVAAARATTSIPIAFYGIGLPVEQGFVDSLARPGRNITGIAAVAGNEEGKLFELLRESVPNATRLAYLRSKNSLQTLSGENIQVRQQVIPDAAKKLGFELKIYGIERSEDIEPAFAAILADRPQVLAVQFHAIMYRERKRIADFALRNKLPSAHRAVQLVEAGGLFYYGANRDALIQYSWTYVDRILRGARPAELPVELPRKFELVVNMKTAKALGLTVPISILLRADRVIE
jgi:putative ABC transport system substrate-binding protein